MKRQSDFSAESGEKKGKSRPTTEIHVGKKQSSIKDHYAVQKNYKSSPKGNSSKVTTNAISSMDDQISTLANCLGQSLSQLEENAKILTLSLNEQDILHPIVVEELNRLLSPGAIPSTLSCSVAMPVTLRPLLSIADLAIHIASEITTNPLRMRYEATLDYYCRKVACVTVCQLLLETVVLNLCEDVSFNRDASMINQTVKGTTLSQFACLFHWNDSPFLEGVDANSTYHWQYGRLPDPLRTSFCLRLSTVGLAPFCSVDIIEPSIAAFYSTHMLSATAAIRGHRRKGQGEVYTPRTVIDFMWDTAFSYAPMTQKIASVLESGKNRKTNNAETTEYIGSLPTVFDPCMGTGGFLCAYINRVTKSALAMSSLGNNFCNNPFEMIQTIEILMQEITASVWGLEIDPHACAIARINVAIHLAPLFAIREKLKRTLPTMLAGEFTLPRFRLITVDALRLDPNEQPEGFRREAVKLLRDPSRLQFDFVLTNPPYMIRKTGKISEPDPEIYHDGLMETGGKMGMQAYAYLIILAGNRLKAGGHMVAITASQWLVLEFAEKLRKWMWETLAIHELFQFEPYKVWPTVQTDSLIFHLSRPLLKVCSPSVGHISTVRFHRHVNRTATLVQMLADYRASVNTELDGFPSNVPEGVRIRKTQQGNDNWTSNCCIITSTTEGKPNGRTNFSVLMPATSTSDRLHFITKDLPGLCDRNGTGKNARWNDLCPLVWNRGPNTNPVYALVVRRVFALSSFGEQVCERWTKPCFYWNGTASKTSLEYRFWKDRDPNRVARKEGSPAEAYEPAQNDTQYVLIMVDKEAANRLREEIETLGVQLDNQDQQLTMCTTTYVDGLRNLWAYLKSGRSELQSGFIDREVAFCTTQKCGADVSAKLIHPINYGYFSKQQPRQRFFTSETPLAVTNQCIYLTVKQHIHSPDDGNIPLTDHFFLGLLNSSIIQFFLSEHCRYDQQGRLRLFRENLARIPFKMPNQCQARAMQDLTRVVKDVRRRIFAIPSTRSDNIIQLVRTGRCRVPNRQLHLDQKTTPIMDPPETIPLYSTTPQGLVDGSTNITSLMDTLLEISATLQYLIDQLCYAIYGIPCNLQLELEEELGLEIDERIVQRFPRENIAVEEIASQFLKDVANDILF